MNKTIPSNFHKFIRAKTARELPYIPLTFFYISYYLLKWRWVSAARWVAESVQNRHKTNRSINLALADIYRQSLRFKDECNALLRIIESEKGDSVFLSRVAEAAAYANDVKALEIISAIAGADNKTLFYYVQGLIAFKESSPNYVCLFNQSVASYLEATFGLTAINRDGGISDCMKECVKSGVKVPEYIRVSYNIREINFPTDFMLENSGKDAYYKELNDGHQPRVSDVKPFILISCSDCYLRVFAEYYLSTFRRRNSNIVHFHVLTENENIIERYLNDLVGRYSNVKYSIEQISERSQAYITISRFLVCRALIEKYKADVLVTDIDINPYFNLNYISERIVGGGSDFGVYDMNHQLPWAKYAAGLIYFRADNKASDLYLRVISSHLNQLSTDGGFFTMDMTGVMQVFEYLKRCGIKHKMFNFYELINLVELVDTRKSLQRKKIECKFGCGAPQ